MGNNVEIHIFLQLIVDRSNAVGLFKSSKILGHAFRLHHRTRLTYLVKCGLKFSCWLLMYTGITYDIYS